VSDISASEFWGHAALQCDLRSSTHAAEPGRRSLPAQLRQEIIEDFQKFRRQAERRLVEHENFRAGHQAAGDREHLLLTAGKEAGALVAARLERSKALEQRFDPARLAG